MKWFKHDSQLSNDPRIKKLRRKHGLEGYGFYILLIELASREVERGDISEIGTLSDDWDIDALSMESGLTPDTIGTISDTLGTLNLITNCDNKITVLGMEKLADEYTSRFITKENIDKKSGHSPDKLPTLSVQNRIEEIRKEKKIKDKIKYPGVVKLEEIYEDTTIKL